MILLAIFLKPVVWYVAFKSAVIEKLSTMLMWAAGVTAVLTLVDKMSVAGNLPASAITLTLALYGMMSFTLFFLAWRIRKKTLCTVFNLVGMIGAFAGVNFTMDVLRGVLR